MRAWLRSFFLPSSSTRRSADRGRDQERILVRNKEYLRATCAAASLVATADGQVSDDELITLLRAVRNLTELSGFTEGEALACFDLCTGALSTNPINDETLLEIISRVRTNDWQARTLMRVCVELARSDSCLAEEEVEMLARICSTLSLEPQRFGFVAAEAA